jgi:hypothetical protein
VTEYLEKGSLVKLLQSTEEQDFKLVDLLKMFVCCFAYQTLSGQLTRLMV